MDCLTDDYFDPAYILLFGRLAGGTPHSDAAAYGLLVVVPEAPDYHWMQAKRILRYRMPVKHRRITYIHLYVMTTGYVESHRAPFLYFAHAEGDLLYCTEHHRFRRPRYPIDFDAAHADDKLHFDTFRMLGNDLLEQAQGAFIEGRNRRLAAIFSPFPCLSAAIRRSGCGHFGDARHRWPGLGLPRAARLSLACRQHPCKNRKISNDRFFIMRGNFE